MKNIKPRTHAIITACREEGWEYLQCESAMTFLKIIKFLSQKQILHIALKLFTIRPRSPNLVHLRSLI